MQFYADTLWFIGQTVYFFIPAAIANIAPVLVKFLPWNQPIYSKYLGPNKTWRGFAAGILFAAGAVLIQQDLDVYRFFSKLSIVDYESHSILLLGTLYGVGALGGDALKSLVKRGLDRAPGSKWQPWDQIDFIIGTWIIFLPIVWVGVGKLVLAIVMARYLHPLFNRVGYILGLKDVPH